MVTLTIVRSPSIFIDGLIHNSGDFLIRAINQLSGKLGDAPCMGVGQTVKTQGW